MKSASDEQLRTAQDEATDRRRLLQSGRIRLVPERPKKTEAEQTREMESAQKRTTE